jgi:phosphatidylinositol alpha-mannosyltransferase
VFSQTLINLLALAILAAITFSSVSLFQGHEAGVAGALAVPAVIVAIILAGPALLRLARRSGSQRLRRAALAITRLFALARSGLAVFRRPRNGLPAIGAQLTAWALQWGSCYMIVLALGLQKQATPATAAAILLAVNVSAVLPATPSNVGVFQAACLVVLAAYGVGAGASLAYGIILQAVEVLTALALGVPALLAEGLTWQDMRSAPAQAEADPATPSEIAGLPAQELGARTPPEIVGPRRPEMDGYAPVEAPAPGPEQTPVRKLRARLLRRRASRMP